MSDFGLSKPTQYARVTGRLSLVFRVRVWLRETTFDMGASVAKRMESFAAKPAKELDASAIQYSRVWEDHRLLSQGLKTQPGDVVLSITSCGDNVLNLLLDEPKKIVAVDLNPSQSALLELKLAAIKHLNYEDYLLLLGENEDPLNQRLPIYQLLKPHLPDCVQEYWESVPDVLQHGLSVVGQMEKSLATFRTEYLTSVVTNDMIDKLFTAKSLDEQNHTFQQLQVDKMEEALSKFVGGELQSLNLDESCLKEVDPPNITYFGRRLSQVCRTVPIWDNFLLSWFLRGQRGFHPDSNPVLSPPFLTRDGFLKLKMLMDRVEVYTGHIEEYLKQPNLPRFHKANLSNIFGIMSQEATDDMLLDLADHMETGGRIAFWDMIECRVPSSTAVNEKFSWLDEEAARLHKQDRVFWYSAFHIAEVK